MSETREALAPCPFCGCKARILETQTDVVVACEGCCVENHFINDIRDTGRSRAIAAWNRRALSARDERAEERERCARVAECFREDEGPVAFRVAAAIRAGGNDGPR